MAEQKKRWTNLRYFVWYLSGVFVIVPLILRTLFAPNCQRQEARWWVFTCFCWQTGILSQRRYNDLTQTSLPKLDLGSGLYLHQFPVFPNLIKFKLIINPPGRKPTRICLVCFVIAPASITHPSVMNINQGNKVIFEGLMSLNQEGTSMMKLRVRSSHLFKCAVPLPYMCRTMPQGRLNAPKASSTGTVLKPWIS